MGSLTNNADWDVDRKTKLTLPGLVLEDIRGGSNILAQVPHIKCQVQGITIWNKDIEIIKSKRESYYEFYYHTVNY